VRRVNLAGISGDFSLAETGRLIPRIAGVYALRLCTLTKCGFGSRVLEDRRVSESQRRGQQKSENSVGRSHVGVHRVETDIRSTPSCQRCVPAGNGGR
jgi:hypothetical protein